MPKRLKYLIASLLAMLFFGLFLALPNDFRYYGLMAGSGVLILSFWLSLGIAFESDFGRRLMFVVLPICFLMGYGLFIVQLPISLVGGVATAVIFGMTVYVMLLVENVFNVAIDFKTVPLYRAAYTVSFILMLTTAFFLFDSILSYRSSFWINFLLSGVVSAILTSYHNWSVMIGEKEIDWSGMVTSVGIPSLILAELSGIFSFWPVGIFRGSVYLVFGMYVVSSLLYADLRDRLFRPVWVGITWIGIAVILAIVLVTRWG